MVSGFLGLSTPTGLTMHDQREATLDDLLREPIIISLMARDGVRAHDIRRLMERLRERPEQSGSSLPRPVHRSKSLE